MEALSFPRREPGIWDLQSQMNNPDLPDCTVVHVVLAWQDSSSIPQCFHFSPTCVPSCCRWIVPHYMFVLHKHIGYITRSSSSSLSTCFWILVNWFYITLCNICERQWVLVSCPVGDLAHLCLHEHYYCWYYCGLVEKIVVKANFMTWH